jgi:hypothetical protein
MVVVAGPAEGNGQLAVPGGAHQGELMVCDLATAAEQAESGR